MTFVSAYINPTESGRQLLIGDIHGCYHTLLRLLEKVDLTKEDQLFLLGDLINKGPYSKEVIDHIMQLQAEGYQIYCIKGNNESLLTKVLKKSEFRIERLAVRFGVVGLFKDKRWKLKKRYKAFFKSMYHFIESDGFYAVHAGFNYESDEPFKDAHAMMWMRNFKADHELQKGKTVIHGHKVIPFKKIKKLIKEDNYEMNLDNGCVLGKLDKTYGRLLCYDWTNKVLYKKKYCEEEAVAEAEAEAEDGSSR